MSMNAQGTNNISWWLALPLTLVSGPKFVRRLEGLVGIYLRKIPEALKTNVATEDRKPNPNSHVHLRTYLLDAYAVSG